MTPDIVSPINFSIAPNPASNSVTVSVATETSDTYSANQSTQSESIIINNVMPKKSTNVIQTKICAIKITDVLGREIRLTNIKVGVSTVKVSLSDMAAGVYFLSVFDGINWSTQKIVVK
jgi:hypothetical protein